MWLHAASLIAGDNYSVKHMNYYFAFYLVVLASGWSSVEIAASAQCRMEARLEPFGTTLFRSFCGAPTDISTSVILPLLFDRFRCQQAR